MEKDIEKIKLDDKKSLLVRVDEFGGEVGTTVREYVESERYTGFTKAGFRLFKGEVNSLIQALKKVNESELAERPVKKKKEE